MGKLQGRAQPRLWTRANRPLTRATTDGYELIEFAQAAGQPFMPWQKWLAVHALEKNPDNTYRYRTIVVMVARQSGKSSFARLFTCWRMYMFPSTQALGIAQELSLAKHQWRATAEIIHENPVLEAEFSRAVNVNGQESFSLVNGSVYRIKASSRKAGRGLTSDLVLVDELREQYDNDAWGAVTYTTMARPGAVILALSNAGDDRSVVLNRLREAAIAGTDPSTGLFEWSAPDGCDLDDRRAWAQACPGLGWTISENAIASAMATDPPTVFRTEMLCQRVDQIDGAFDLAAWNDCADPSGTMTGLRDQLAAGVDVAPDGEHVTLAVAAKMPDGRIRVEIPGAWQDTDTARAALPNLLDRIRPITTAWYPSGPAGALAPLLLQRPASLKLAGTDVNAACMGLADLVRARRVVHNADPLLQAHVAAARRLPSGDGWRLSRRGEGHVDAAYAAAAAVHALLTQPAQPRARIRVIS